MTIKITDRWADLGSVSEPTTAKKALGWVDGESPPAAYENWVQQDARDKINEIIEDGPDPYSPYATDTTLMMKYIPATGDGKGVAFGKNYFMESPGTPGFVSSYVDLCFWIDAGGDKKILALNQDLCQIDVFDVATLTIESDNDISAGFGVPTTAWAPLSMCCDGAYVYVVAYDTGSTDTKIQSFACNGLAVKGGWPATGRALSARTRVLSGVDLFIHGICFATSDILAVSQSWLTWVDATTDSVVLVAKGDGAIGLAGSGDMTLTGSGHIDGPITSDGANIYFTSCDSGATAQICSATIADPEAGCGGTDFPFPVAAGDYGICIRHVGSQVVSSFHDAEANRRLIYVSTDANAYIGYFITDSYSLVRQGGKFDFDGRYIWMHTTYLNGAAVANCIVVIDTAVMVNLSGINHMAVDITTPGIIQNIIAITDADLEREGDSGTYTPLGSVLFDGRDIWVVGDPQPSIVGWSGKIWGIYKAGMRG